MSEHYTAEELRAAKDAFRFATAEGAGGPDAVQHALDEVAPRIIARVAREAESLRAEAAALRNLAEQIVSVHEQVVMDTPEERDLHDRACATFRAVLNPHAAFRAALNTRTGSRPCVCGGVGSGCRCAG